MAISDLLPRHPATNELYRLTSAPRNQSSEKEIARFLLDIEKNAIERSIVVMLNELYCSDVESLERDLIKVAFINVKDASEISALERANVLRSLWWVFKLHFEGRTDVLIQMCKDLAD